MSCITNIAENIYTVVTDLDIHPYLNWVIVTLIFLSFVKNPVIEVSVRLSVGSKMNYAQPCVLKMNVNLKYLKKTNWTTVR